MKNCISGWACLILSVQLKAYDGLLDAAFGLLFAVLAVAYFYAEWKEDPSIQKSE